MPNAPILCLGAVGAGQVDVAPLGHPRRSCGGQFQHEFNLKLEAVVQAVEDLSLKRGDVVVVHRPRAAFPVDGEGVAAGQTGRLEVVQVDGAKERGQVLRTVAVAHTFVSQRKFGDRRAEAVGTI